MLLNEDTKEVSHKIGIFFPCFWILFVIIFLIIIWVI